MPLVSLLDICYYISMNKTTVIQSREIAPKDIELIKQLIDINPSWRRTRLSKELCILWNWQTDNGMLKDMSCRNLLLKLEKQKLIKLPGRKSGTTGENLKYMVYDSQGRPLACLLFGACAWTAAPRDDFIGWDSITRKRNLNFVTNNMRFLILPWVKVEHLASHILSKVARRIKDDWTAKYGHPVYMLETFVECGRFLGTCYKASNWICVGKTKGRSRNDRYKTLKVPIKDIYLYPLVKRFKEVLSS